MERSIPKNVTRKPFTDAEKLQIQKSVEVVEKSQRKQDFVSRLEPLTEFWV